MVASGAHHIGKRHDRRIVEQVDDDEVELLQHIVMEAGTCRLSADDIGGLNPGNLDWITDSYREGLIMN